MDAHEIINQMSCLRNIYAPPTARHRTYFWDAAGVSHIVE